MLMILDTSLGQKPSSNLQKVKTALDVLALGFREGKHIIAGYPKTINALLKSQEIENNTKSVLLTIKERFSQLMALQQNFSSYALICSDEYPIEKKSVDGKHVVQIPISFFSHSGKIQPTVLLTENLDDAKIAGEIARYYRASVKLNNLPIRYDPRSGGGSSMPANLNSIQHDQERFCVVLADSDKAAPKSATGPTAQSLINILQKNNWPMTALLILKCREMENAIPDSVWSEVFSKLSNHQNSATFLRELTAKCPESRSYIDIKMGLSLRDIFNQPESSPEHLFWHSKITLLNQLPALASECDSGCLTHQTCFSNNDCKCQYLLPNKARLLSLAHDVLKKWGQAEWRTLEERCQQIWNDIGKLVFEWSCGWEFSAI